MIAFVVAALRLLSLGGEDFAPKGHWALKGTWNVSCRPGTVMLHSESKEGS